ncbi:MAG: T9SS type A sorting domain-containing protein, partial [Bacteroidetes bacterium]|nr:T9SS type A sorting domain-containing protein [Bacteroidota bacterium]
NKRADQFQNLDFYYVVSLRKTDPNALWQDGDRIIATPNYVLVGGRTFDVTTEPVVSSTELASAQISKINVVPNPYFGRNASENNQFNRFVTFTHLPQVATIRVITITGELVRTIQHNDNSSLERWDLRNENALPVASGVYIVHIEIPDAGNRILKLAIIQPEERATRI